jgi:hypothetical protein
MDEAEAFSIANRARSKKRWAKVRAAQAAGESPVLQGAPVQVVVPRTQDTRTSQVFGPPVLPNGKPPRRPDIWKRVRQRLRAEIDAPSGYWNRKQRQYALTLEEFAKDFTATGHVKEATQIYLVLYGKTQPLAVTEGIREPCCASPPGPGPPLRYTGAESACSRTLRRYFAFA